MATPILATKLYLPPPRPLVVLRPRLIERLNAGLHHRLTLLSAPAGFGKTTLLSAWLADRMRQSAWLSLDEEENDPARFLAYLIAAVQTIAAHVGKKVLRVLQSPQPPSTETVLTTLLNDITAISDQFVLVLDDYHLIDAKPVDQILTYLIEHPPPQMHLVIATREDSHLSLARLRARDHVTELRAADLRFTPAEAADFLTQVMGLHLSAEDITRWDGAPKAGLSVCNWRLFPCKDSQMPPDCTVKGHNLSIFGKLQVQRRTEAVARARELGLL